MRDSGRRTASVTVRLLLPARTGRATTTPGPSTPPLGDEIPRHTTAPPQPPAAALEPLAAVQVRELPAAPTADRYLLNRREVATADEAGPTRTVVSGPRMIDRILCSGYVA
ncbi:hypothetical protein ACPPVO_36215 [Dactylosporangium sp. McL0621]|uniref:hypothetical protein n=1 Tax=Dactylosporangium sp. McL0621 TaxID=3415678 RepID=UPI003CEC3400